MSPEAKDALEKQLDEIRSVVCELKKISPAAVAQLAATPEGRQKMLANRAHFTSYRQMLAGTVRELAELDRIFDKALRKGRWGIRA